MIEYHETLNPKLWLDNKLIPEVKNKLMEIYQVFINKLKENEIPIEVIDVLILGSNAAYNYTDNSDIDLHIVTDFNDLSLNSTLAQIFYNNEKSKFNEDYDITIKGLPVEIYIEDINAGTKSAGVYSLLQDKWLKFPEYNKPEDIDYSFLLNIYQNKVNDVINGNIEQIKNIINEIKMLRKLSLMNDGEYSKGNLVFKELRNNGSIDKLYDRLKELTSKELSLEKINKLKESYGDEYFYKFIVFSCDDDCEQLSNDNKYIIEKLESNIYIAYEKHLVNPIIDPDTIIKICNHADIDNYIKLNFKNVKILCNGTGSTRQELDYNINPETYENIKFNNWLKYKNIKVSE